MYDHLPLEIIARAGGLFEGEGCVNIMKDMTARVTVSSSVRETLVFLMDWFGGRMSTSSPRPMAPHWAPEYTWTLSRRVEVAAFARAIAPYAGSKTPQLNLLVCVVDLRLRLGRRVSDSHRAYIAGLSAVMSRMKRPHRYPDPWDGVPKPITWTTADDRYRYPPRPAAAA
jgi:hypothetical protein